MSIRGLGGLGGPVRGIRIFERNSNRKGFSGFFYVHILKYFIILQEREENREKLRILTQQALEHESWTTDCDENVFSGASDDELLFEQPV